MSAKTRSSSVSSSISLSYRRKKPTGKNAKAVKDDNTKELFENGEWARNDVTMERVGKSVLMYSFVKDGQGKGERLDGSVSVVSAGQTFRVRLQDFMYEEKKGGVNVFPPDVDIIPVFSVVEIMVTPANQGGFDQGYGLSLARVRVCDFSLYSMCGPLGLGLLPPTYTSSLELVEGWRETNPGLKRVLEEKNTGFFGRVTQGSYFIRWCPFVRVFCFWLTRFMAQVQRRLSPRRAEGEPCRPAVPAPRCHAGRRVCDRRAPGRPYALHQRLRG